MPVNWTCFKVVISKTTSKLEYFDFGHQNNAICNCSDTGYQWLSGVGSGAWFKLVDIGDGIVHRVRRLSLSGSIHIDEKYKMSSPEYDSSKSYKFLYNLKCSYFHIKQNEKNSQI